MDACGVQWTLGLLHCGTGFETRQDLGERLGKKRLLIGAVGEQLLQQRKQTFCPKLVPFLGSSARPRPGVSAFVNAGICGFM